MRRNCADRFGIRIVIAELLFFRRFLARHNLGSENTLLPEAGAQYRQQVGRLREPFA